MTMQVPHGIWTVVVNTVPAPNFEAQGVKHGSSSKFLLHFNLAKVPFGCLTTDDMNIFDIGSVIAPILPCDDGIQDRTNRMSNKMARVVRSKGSGNGIFESFI
jgi:hypothetical protein